MNDILIGQTVISKAGRDKGERFIVVEYDKPFVFLVDGKLRRVEDPKKKKEKHIQVTHIVDEEMHNQLVGGYKISNADIRKSLSHLDNNNL